MKLLFVVADVHSFYEEMIKTLSEQGFDRDNTDHIFVSLGVFLIAVLLPWSALISSILSRQKARP